MLQWLKECEDERKEIIQEDTEEKIPPLFIRVVRDFDFKYFRGERYIPRWEDKGAENRRVFLIPFLTFWMQGLP